MASTPIAKTRLFSWLPLICLCCISYSQPRITHIPLYPGSDSNYTYHRVTQRALRLGLAPLLTTEQAFNFRLYTGRQIIDIFADNNRLYGSITSYITEIPRKKQFREENRIFSQCLLLTGEQLKPIKQYIETSGIYNLPSFEDIEGWRIGADGSQYCIEYTTADHYYFKSYWSPELQSLPVATAIQKFVDSILLLADASTARDYMERDIPFECYNPGSAISACIVLSKKEKRALRRKQRTYTREGRIR